MESSIAFIILLGLVVIVLSITTIVLIIRVNKLEDIVMDHDNEIHERFKPDVEYVSWRQTEDLTVKGKADSAYLAVKMVEDRMDEFFKSEVGVDEDGNYVLRGTYDIAGKLVSDITERKESLWKHFCKDVCEKMVHYYYEDSIDIAHFHDIFNEKFDETVEEWKK